MTNRKQPNVIYQKNKKSGTIYAYEDHPYWDSEKKQSRSKRKCLGKVDPQTGKIVPTRGRKLNTGGKKQREEDCRSVGNDAKIDASAILQTLDKKITDGLRSGEYTLTDISILISSAVEDVKKKIMLDVENIINEETKDDAAASCELCGDALKKTIKETKPKQ